jgi:hypothetical protein
MFYKRLSTLLALGWALTMAIPAHSSNVATFNFDSDPIGEPTPLSDTNNGLTATFNSPADPGGFAVGPTFFTTLTGNVLLDPGPSFASGIPLDIAFSANATSVSMLFATDGSGTFFLNAYENGTLVGSASAFGIIEPTGFPEGTITFNAASFNSIVLTSPSTPYFAIDNMSVTTGAVPEPSCLALMGIGFLGLGSMLLRRSPVSHLAKIPGA